MLVILNCLLHDIEYDKMNKMGVDKMQKIDLEGHFQSRKCQTNYIMIYKSRNKLFSGKLEVIVL